MYIFNIHASFKTIQVTKKPAPWLTPNFKLINLKKEAFCKYKKLQTLASYNDYKELRNLVNRSVRVKKKVFLQFKNDSKRFQKTLKYLVFRKICK